jgi:tetratricopeptide (TPR) repeat protein
MAQKLNSPVILLILTLLTAFLLFALLNAKKMQAMALLLEDQEKIIATLKEQIRVLDQQGIAENIRAKQLEASMSEMAAQHKVERNLIEELWRMLMKRSSSASANILTQTTAPKYDGEVIKKMASECGGDLSAVLKKVVTEEGLRATLDKHSSEPDYWVACASLLGDKTAALKQLEQAAILYPDSPTVLMALVKTRLAEKMYDASTLAYIDQLKRADRDNAWADYFEAAVLFRTGHAQDALRTLMAARNKSRCSDDTIETLVARHDYLLQAGCSYPTALGLSAFTYDFPQLVLLTQMRENVQEQMQSLTSSGRYEEALQLAETLTRMGSLVSASGPFVVYDRVGTSLFQSGVCAQKAVYEAMGNTSLAGETEQKLQALKDRISIMDTMVAAFGKALPEMSVEDLAAYIEDAMADGEFAALQTLPSVAHDMEQALPKAAH